LGDSPLEASVEALREFPGRGTPLLSPPELPGIILVPALVLHPSGLVPLFFLRETALKQVAEIVRDVASRVTAARGFELVDVELKKQGRHYLVRLFVDKEGGIGLDHLQAVSEEVSAILDAEDPIESSYTLEVSSPGLDRPLKTLAEYGRFLGRLVKVSSYEPVEGRRHWTGRLVSVEGGILSVKLEREGDAFARIPFEKISHGRLEVEF
jgi:ribosome maturation factor RimP